jgi:hypothetical protein
VAFELPLRAGEPPARPHGLAPEQRVVSDPERAADRPIDVAGGEVRGVRTLERADVVVVPAQHVRRPREQLEIVRTQASRRVGRRQPLIRVAPGRRGVGPPAPVEVVGCTRHARIIEL